MTAAGPDLRARRSPTLENDPVARPPVPGRLCPCGPRPAREQPGRLLPTRSGGSCRGKSLLPARGGRADWLHSLFSMAATETVYQCSPPCMPERTSTCVVGQGNVAVHGDVPDCHERLADEPSQQDEAAERRERMSMVRAHCAAEGGLRRRRRVVRGLRRGRRFRH